MIVSIEKPGTPSEILHFGVKGMHWGIRKEETSSSNNKSKTIETDAEKSIRRKATAKKVAIGTGALIAIAGTAFVAYKLHQSGNLPIKSLKKPSPQVVKTVKNITHEQTSVIHFSRGKERTYRFFKQGGVPNALEEYEKAFGKDASKVGAGKEFFERLDSGKVAASFFDPLGRRDRSGRPIKHDVIVPHSMSSNIHSLHDILEKIWPQIKDTYDPT